MSFRDIEGGVKFVPPPKRLPPQRQDEGSRFEQDIKASIQEIQDKVRTATQQLERPRFGGLSIRTKHSLDKFVEKSRELVEDTERQFREWTVHFAGEPIERHRKRASFEKLQRNFDDEVAHLKTVASRYAAAQQDALVQQGHTECAVIEDQDIVRDTPEEEELGLLSMRSDMQLQQYDGEIQSRIVQERDEGIQRITSQVCEVNKIFKDLAVLVQDQGQQLDTIDTHAESTVANTKEAVVELSKAAKRQAGTRENLCYILVAAVVLLCLLFFHYMRFDNYIAHSDGSGNRVEILQGRPDLLADGMSPFVQPGLVQTETLAPSALQVLQAKGFGASLAQPEPVPAPSTPPYVLQVDGNSPIMQPRLVQPRGPAAAPPADAPPALPSVLQDSMSPFVHANLVYPEAVLQTSSESAAEPEATAAMQLAAELAAPILASTAAAQMPVATESVIVSQVLSQQKRAEQPSAAQAPDVSPLGSTAVQMDVAAPSPVHVFVADMQSKLEVAASLRTVRPISLASVPPISGNLFTGPLILATSGKIADEHVE